MALIGPDGNALPDVMPDGVFSYDFMSINGRVFTEHQRQPFNPDFGVGFIHALRSPAITSGEIRRRLVNSFRGDPGYVGVESVRVSVDDLTFYDIDISVEIPHGRS